MNEQLQAALTALVKRLTEVTDVAIVQIPPLVKDMIAYQIVDTWAWLVVFSFMLLFFMLYLRWYIRVLRKGAWTAWYDGQNFSGFLGGIISVAGGLVMISKITFAITLLIKLYSYPNVWVVSYLKDML